MQKWEYCQVSMKAAEVKDEHELEELKRTYSDNIQIRKERGIILVSQVILRYMKDNSKQTYHKSFPELIEQLGNEGWELVSHTEVKMPTNVEYFYFKRPVQE